VQSSEYSLSSLREILHDIGFTEEDLEASNREMGVQGSSESEQFLIPVEYSLDGSDFIARIINDEIQYNDSFTLGKIDFLMYFGCASADETGYMFVPDASGAIIELNRPYVPSTPFMSRVYGDDLIYSNDEKYNFQNHITMPVFGMYKNKTTMLAILEDSEAYANITAYTSSMVNAFNFIYSSFTVNQPQELKLDGGRLAGSKIFLYPKQRNRAGFTVRYRFLSKEMQGYAGMAASYREYLITRGRLQYLEQDSVPFFMELTGSVQTDKNRFGIAYKGTTVTTDYAQALQIIEETLKGDVSNLRVKVTNWANGGSLQYLPDTVNYIDGVGNKKALSDFSERLRERDVELFMGMDFHLAYSRGGVYDYPNQKYYARALDSKTVVKPKYSKINNKIDLKNPSPLLISAKSMQKLFAKFQNRFEKLKIANLAPGQLGYDCYSDLRSDGEVNRQESIKYIEQMMEEAKAAGGRLMLNNANAYALKYEPDIIALPVIANDSMILTGSVPFYQMVIKGCINYAGEALNYASDAEIEVLHAIETGSGIYVSNFYTNNIDAKIYGADDFYASDYRTSLEKCISYYQTVKEALEPFSGQKIVNHEILSPKIRRITYSGGGGLIVNYGEQEFQLDEQKIPARGFIHYE